MLKALIGFSAAIALAVLAGCAPMTTTPQYATPVVQGTPGKAVVYLVRTRPDLSYLTASVQLNDQMIGATYAGTYFRLELPAGRHRLSGYGSDNGSLTFDVQADRVYFVQHTVSGSWRAVNPHSFFRVIDEARGRAALANAEAG